MSKTAISIDSKSPRGNDTSSMLNKIRNAMSPSSPSSKQPISSYEQLHAQHQAWKATTRHLETERKFVMSALIDIGFMISTSTVLFYCFVKTVLLLCHSFSTYIQIILVWIMFLSTLFVIRLFSDRILSRSLQYAGLDESTMKSKSNTTIDDSSLDALLETPRRQISKS